MLCLYVVVGLFVVVSGYDYAEVESDLDYEEEETQKVESVTRVRRYDPQMTFDPRNEDQVKEALNKIFSGRRLNLIQPQDFDQFLVPNYKNISFTKLNSALNLLQELGSTSSGITFTPMPQYFFEDVVDNITSFVKMFTMIDDNGQSMEEKATRSSPYAGYLTPTRKYEWYRQHTVLTADRGLLGETQKKSQSEELHLNITKAKDPSMFYIRNMFNRKPAPPGKLRQGDEDTPDTTTTPSDDEPETAETGDAAEDGNINGTVTEAGDGGNVTVTKGNLTDLVANETLTNATYSFTCPTLPTTTTTTTTTTVRTTMHFDIERFLEIVANLTYDYYTNLTEQLNITLKRMSAPTCPTLTPPSTEPDYSVYNDSLRAKCFVCGMEEPGVPWNADCADAFAGDFIPLVPQSPRAKGSIAKFRKYCLFKDIHNFFINKSMPRMMFGRWTGGCSVRWTDVSGIYTQRTCRSKYKAATGKSFASKRMAKLEMTLQHSDRGCIISPVASLLPLSRAISLYARFHACVCTGNWCNVATRMLPTLGVVFVCAVSVSVSLRIFSSL